MYKLWYMADFTLQTDNLSSKSSNLTEKQMDEARRNVNPKLRPFQFHIKTYYLSDANYSTDNPSLTDNPWSRPCLEKHHCSTLSRNLCDLFANVNWGPLVGGHMTANKSQAAFNPTKQYSWYATISLKNRPRFDGRPSTKTTSRRFQFSS